MAGREHFSAAMAGRKHTGKSTFLNQVAKEYAAAHPDKRILIINVNASPAYAEHDTITYDNFPRWKKGVKQFYDSDHKAMLSFIINLYNPKTNPRSFDGLMIFEDCTKYIEAQPDKQIKSFLVDHRMWKADLMFTFHSIDFIPKFFWKMINMVEVFKTQDIFEGRENELRKRIPNFDEVLKVHTHVMNNKSDYYHKTVKTLI